MEALELLCLPSTTLTSLLAAVMVAMTFEAVANGVGLRYRTVREIALAWVLTLPATMLLGGMLFLLFRSLDRL